MYKGYDNEEGVEVAWNKLPTKALEESVPTVCRGFAEPVYGVVLDWSRGRGLIFPIVN